MKKILFVSLIAWTLVGCKKEPVVTQNVTQNQPTSPSQQREGIATYVLKIDGQKVNAADFNINLYPYNLVTAEPIPNSEDGIITVHAFTTVDRYFNFGESASIPLRKLAEVETTLTNYAESSGAIREYEATGVIPQRYLEYEANYYKSVAPELALRASAMLHKDCPTGQGASAVIPGTLPAMWPGWNNDVSRYFHFSIYGGLAIYDRTFYRSRITTLWNWGWNNFNFCQPELRFIDNRMTSGICM